MSSLVGASDDRKVTPGITELSRPRAHNAISNIIITLGRVYRRRGLLHRCRLFLSWSCRINKEFLCFCKRPRVGVFTHQKGSWAGFRTLWGSLFNIYWKCKISERKDLLVREERGFDATGLPVIWQGKQGSYALTDKCWKHLSTKLSLKRDI